MTHLTLHDRTTVGSPPTRRAEPLPYWHAYVDESGDRGWKRRPAGLQPGTRAGSSEHFCLTAVLVPNGAQPAILERWEQVAVEIGRTRSDTIHWTKVRSHPQRLHLCSAVHAVEDLRVISVVFSKWDVRNAWAVRAPDDIYTWTLRLLVERLSWFGRHHQTQTIMHFAQVKGLPPQSIADYLSGLQRQATNIEWGHLMMPAKVDTPRNQRMLQIADTASGAVYAAFEWDEYGNTERRYLDTLYSRLWRPAGGTLQTYGLKICPWPHPRHSWVRTFCRP